MGTTMDDASLATWLHLREAADWAARSSSLTAAVVASLPAARPLRILDLGTGRLSNVRYLMAHLPPRQHWVVVDRSAAVIDAGLRETTRWAEARGYGVRADAGGLWLRGGDLECRIEARIADLATLDAGLFAGRHLVTAAALLDLVSAAWLDTLAARCREQNAAALFALTYDGRSSALPAEDLDARVRTLLNAHQLRDKGLGGRAAGPEATACAERSFRAAGYQVRTAASDWELSPETGAMQAMLIDGWAEAAVELAPAEADAIRAWQRARQAHVDAGRSSIRVGHWDVAAWG